MQWKLLVLVVAMCASAHAATLTVTSSADAGAGTLRDTIAAANPTDEIVFDSAVGPVITLATVLVLNKDLEINGPGAGALEINGNAVTGIFHHTAGTVTIRGLTLKNGSAFRGGAILQEAGTTLKVERCVLDDNQCNDPSFDGGGAIRSLGTLSVYDSTISNNQNIGVSGGGGGIWMAAGGLGSLTLERCTFTGNQSYRCASVGSSAVPMTVRSCAFYANHALDTRAALYGQGTTTTFTVENCTFANNTAVNNWGGFFPIQGTWNIRNCTCSGNQFADFITSGPGVTVANNLFGTVAFFTSAAVTSQGYNVVSNPGGVSGWHNTDMIGAAAPIPLGLGPMQDNGGPTFTMLPQQGSPAIDLVLGPAPQLDQRGLVRLGTADSGAADTGGAGALSISPNPAFAGSGAQLTGLQMNQVTGVLIGGVAATLGAATATTLDITLSPTTPVGPNRLVEVLIGASGKQEWMTVDVDVIPTPVVTGVSPNPVLQGGQLTITGTFLDNAVSVYIGATSQVIVTNTSVEIVIDVSPTQPHAPGQVVEVTTALGMDNSHTVDVLAPPQINGVLPSPVPPGQMLTISGLYLENASAVTIGGTPAPIQSNTAIEIVVEVSPTQTQGPGQSLEVTTPGGTDSLLVDITLPPTVTGVAPNPVAPGAVLTISGTELDNASAVTIDAVAAIILTNTATTITVTVDAGQTPGPGQIVSVTTPGGTDAGTTVDILPPPSVTGVSPNPILVGNLLTLTGTSLANANPVTVGGIVCVLQSNTDTQIVALIGSTHVVGIDQVISVTTPGGTDATATVTIEAPPTSSGGARSTGGGGCTAGHGGMAALALLLLLRRRRKVA